MSDTELGLGKVDQGVACLTDEVLGGHVSIAHQTTAHHLPLLKRRLTSPSCSRLELGPASVKNVGVGEGVQIGK